MCYTIFYISPSFRQVTKQNLRRRDCFIVVTEDPVNISDSVARTDSRRYNLVVSH